MRLIDADNLIDYFYFGIDDKPIIDGISDRKIIDIIKNQLTAYDINKVIRELRRASGNGYRDVDGDYVSPMIKTEKAIEIVKHGGVRKDVE